MTITSRFDELSGDRRGVSEVLGAVLVFGLVLLLLMVVQVTAVPAANQQVEYDHSKRALDDVQTFDHGVDRAAATGQGSSASIEAGVRYPTRLFLLNPPPAAGTVRTTGGESFELEGFVAVNPESADYLDASGAPIGFETTSFEYDPAYNEFASAPLTRYESGAVYDTYDDGVLVRDAGAVVSGRRIALVALAGSMATTSVDNVVLETVPLSGPAGPVAVAAPPGVSPSIVVETGLSAATWRTEILAGAYDAAGDPTDGRYVTGVACLEPGVDDGEACDGRLRITFEPDVTYDLRLAKVGVGSSGAAESESAWYLTTPQTGTITVPNGGSQELVVVARDRFNNPVSGVPVTFTLDDGDAGSFVGDSTDVRTDEDGSARVVFAAAPTFDGGPVDVTATAGDLADDPDGNGDRVETGAGSVADHEVVEYGTRLTVVSPPGGDDDGLDINPNSTGKVALTDASAVGGGGDSTVTLTFESKAGGDVDLVGGRVNYHSTGGPGSSAGSSPTEVEIGGTVLEVSGEFRTVASPITVGTTGTDVALSWNGEIQGDHFYILTLEFSNGEVETYFVSHPK